jgi:hypothetical protein
MFFLPAILSAQKEKPSEINDSRGFVVAGVVLLGLASTILGVLY